MTEYSAVNLSPDHLIIIKQCVWFKSHVTVSLLHFFFFFLFPLLWLLCCSVSNTLRLVTGDWWSLDHSLCSCWSKSGVNSPSFTRRLARELFIICPEPCWPLLPVKLLPPDAVRPRLLFCACEGSVMVASDALIRRVIFRTPCWMMSSSSCWISRTKPVSGNMSMKR